MTQEQTHATCSRKGPENVVICAHTENPAEEVPGGASSPYYNDFASASTRTSLRDGRSDQQRSRHDEIRQRRTELKHTALMMVDEAIRNDAETLRLQRKMALGATRADLTDVEWTRVHLRWVYIHKGKDSALFSARQALLARQREYREREQELARRLESASWRNSYNGLVVKHTHRPGMIMCVICTIRWSNFDESQP